MLAAVQGGAVLLLLSVFFAHMLAPAVVALRRRVRHRSTPAPHLASRWPSSCSTSCWSCRPRSPGAARGRGGVLGAGDRAGLGRAALQRRQNIQPVERPIARAPTPPAPGCRLLFSRSGDWLHRARNAAHPGRDDRRSALHQMAARGPDPGLPPLDRRPRLPAVRGARPSARALAVASRGVPSATSTARWPATSARKRRPRSSSASRCVRGFLLLGLPRRYRWGWPPACSRSCRQSAR